MTETEFQELTKNAPNFTSMEHGELVTYAYAMYAAGIKTDAENAKLRKLAKQMHTCLTRPKVYDGESPYLTATECPYFTEGACDYNACGFEQCMKALGIE